MEREGFCLPHKKLKNLDDNIRNKSNTIMKKLNLLLLLIFSAISLNISAHDFEVVNSDGKTIYYNITSSTDLTLSVT